MMKFLFSLASMHGFLSRANAIFAFTLSVLAAVTFACFLTTAFHSHLAPVLIKASKVNVKHLPDYTAQRAKNDLGLLNLDVQVDVSPLFNWNVKQLFLYLSAEYKTEKNSLNQVVLWDKIIVRGDNPVVDIQAANTKYYFWDDGNGLLSFVSLGGVSAVQLSSLMEPLILVDQKDQQIGSASKLDCHIYNNVKTGDFLHRAFSLFVLNSENQMLLQKRAAEKVTFPGVWSNACCSHPLNNANESVGEECIGVRRAAVRRTQFELGLQLTEANVHFVTRVLYGAVSCDAWAEHEMDYVLITKTDNTTNHNTHEISQLKWVNQQQLNDMMADANILFSPWLRLIHGSLLPQIWKYATLLPNIPPPDQQIHNLMQHIMQ